jgi:hypothetical protein
VPENSASLPDFTRWPSFPFEGDMRVKKLAAPVDVEPPRSGEDAADCVACNTPDDAYIWVSERWRVRAMDRPTGLPMVLILECRSHLDLGDLPNLLAAELGVMTVRLERAIRTLDEVARVHVNRWGDGSAHLHMWFLARPYGWLQLRGTFLSLWDDILPVIPEQQWRGNLALVAAWLAEFGGRANAEPPHIQWQSPGTISDSPTVFSTDDSSADDSSADDSSADDSVADSGSADSDYATDRGVGGGQRHRAVRGVDVSSTVDNAGAVGENTAGPWRPADLADIEESTADSRSVGAAFADAAADDLAGQTTHARAPQGAGTGTESAVGASVREGTNVRLGGTDASAGLGSDSGPASAEGVDTLGGETSGAARTGEVATGVEPTGDHHAGSKTANGDAFGPDVIGNAARGGDSSQAGEAVGGDSTGDNAENRDTSRHDGDVGGRSASVASGEASSTNLTSRQSEAGATARP